jgi:integrase
LARRSTTGIRKRHSRGCRSRQDGACNCTGSWEAAVYSARDDKKIRKSFSTEAAAKAWRSEANVALRKGTLKAPTRETLRDAAERFLAGIDDGTIRTRQGRLYKPSTRRAYRRSLEAHVLPELGGSRLSEIRRADVQDLADRLGAAEFDASTIQNALMPLRVIYRRALRRGDIAVNPTADLDLPAVEGRRDRIASPAEAEALLAALDETDRAIYATALYAGLRLGELRALRWEDVDLERNVLRVERAWDALEGVIEPKSKAGRRTVPIGKTLRAYLLRHQLASGRRGGLVFGRTPTVPFDTGGIWKRSRKAWTAAELSPLTLHEARHTFASLMIAAGVNTKALTDYMGHASVRVTFDRYGHLMPGNETEAAGLLDDYLEKATGAQTGAQGR